MFHDIFALSYYICSIIYFFTLVGQIKEYGQGLLTDKQRNRLTFLEFYRYSILVILVLALISLYYVGSRVPTSYLEWVGTFVLMSFFSLAALIDDDYVEMVTPPEKMPPSA